LVLADYFFLKTEMPAGALVSFFKIPRHIMRTNALK
jgi:hypothetical protein